MAADLVFPGGYIAAALVYPSIYACGSSISRWV